MNIWTVTINDSWECTTNAPTVGEACSIAGDLWRAEFTGGEDRGLMFSVRAKRGAGYSTTPPDTEDAYVSPVDDPAVVADVVTERNRLRALVFMLYRTLSDEPITNLAWLTPEAKELLTQVVQELGPHLNPDRAKTAMQVVTDERDRLQGAARDLVSAAKTWVAAFQVLTSPEVRQHAVDALANAIDAFDPMLSETTEGKT